MVVPLKHDDRAIGVVTLLSTRPGRRYDEIDLKLVEKLAFRAAIAIERAMMREFERRISSRLQLLQSLTSHLSRAVTVQDVARVMVTDVAASVGAPWLVVYRRTADGTSLELLAARGTDGRPSHPSMIPLSHERPLVEVVRTGSPIFLASEAEVERYPSPFALPSAEGGVGYLPLLVEDRVIGAFSLGFAKDRTLDETEQGFLQTAASQCAQALERAHLYSQAEQAVRLRDDFLSIASHELNTPLTSLKLALGHLGRAQHEPPTLARLLGVVERQADRLGSLVSDLLDVSGLASGPVTLEMAETDLVRVVEDTVSKFSTELDRSGSQAVVRTPGTVVGCWDRKRLEQVTACLMSNAIKFGRGKPIEIGVEREGEIARLSVRDRGIGIPEERQARIFDRFERAVATPHFGGFGLGLWLARRVIESMRGRIFFESALGLGTLFVVELPIAPSEA